jgi:hypothetical protein
MHRDDIRLAKQCLLVDESGAGGAGLRLGQVLAPGDQLHTECKTDARNLFSDVAQPDDRERFTPQVRAEAGLPPTRLQRSGFPVDAPHARQDERPGELDSGSRVIAGRGNRDAEIGCRPRIDGGVSRSSRRYEFEVWELLQDLPWKRSAFSHDAYHLERAQSFDNGRGIGQVVIENDDLGLPTDA